MKDQDQIAGSRDAAAAKPSTKENLRGYEKPALIRRARLSEVTAVSKASGISTDT